MKFSDLKIGDLFVELYVDSFARIFEKKSLSTAYCFDVKNLKRNGEVTRFGKSVQVYLVD